MLPKTSIAELAEAVLAGVKVLEGLGAEIVEVQLPDMDPYVAAWPTFMCSAEAVAAHEATYPSRRDDYGPLVRGWLDKGAKVTGAEYAKANNLRAACTGHLRRVFEEIDVLACPSTSAPPHPIKPEELYGPMPESREPKFQRFTAPFDFNGAPTLSVPCGFNSEGLPLSIQWVGKHSVRTVVMPDWSRLRRGNRVAQSASGCLRINFKTYAVGLLSPPDKGDLGGWGFRGLKIKNLASRTEFA